MAFLKKNTQKNKENGHTNGAKEPKELEEYEKFHIMGGVVGEIVTDRASTFQSHAIRVSNIEDINKYLLLLKSNNKIQKATHNILVYRLLDEKKKLEKTSKSKTIDDFITEAFDDDGEDGAGDRLLSVLRKMKVYNVMVVVSRWFGGINLGNDRFRHINDSAKKIILCHKTNFDWTN